MLLLYSYYRSVLDSQTYLSDVNPHKHPVRMTIQHWQLRDLVLCPQMSNDRTSVVFPNHNNLHAYDVEAKTTTALLKDVAFSPTSVAAKYVYDRAHI